MAVVDALKRNNAMSDLERYTLHAVRELLREWNVYHAVWEISIYQRNANTIEITAWIPERTTLPGNREKPVVPIHFHQTGGPFRDFTDVRFQPIARELRKEMTKAFQLGPQYGRA